MAMPIGKWNSPGSEPLLPHCRRKRGAAGWAVRPGPARLRPPKPSTLRRMKSRLWIIGSALFLRITCSIRVRSVSDGRAALLLRHPLLPLVATAATSEFRFHRLRLARFGWYRLPVPEHVVPALALRAAPGGVDELVHRLGLLGPQPPLYRHPAGVGVLAYAPSHPRRAGSTSPLTRGISEQANQAP